MSKFFVVLAVRVMLLALFTGTTLGLAGLPLNRRNAGIYILVFWCWMIVFQMYSTRSRMMKPKSFAELEKQKHVCFNELHATLKDYARGGWAVKANAVIGIIQRTQLNDRQRHRLRQEAIRGVCVHNNKKEPQEMAQYHAVAIFLQDTLSDAAFRLAGPTS